MDKSKMLETAVSLAKIGMQEPTMENGYIGNASQEMRELHGFLLDLLLAEQKREEGCGFCKRHEEQHQFSIDGDYLVDHSDYGDNSSLLIYYCPNCGRKLTEE